MYVLHHFESTEQYTHVKSSYVFQLYEHRQSFFFFFVYKTQLININFGLLSKIVHSSWIARYGG